MKLNKNTLKKLIQEVVSEHKKETWILTEATEWTQYGRIMDLFSGEVGSVDQIVIMSAMNPHAQEIPDEQNDLRNAAFLKDLKSGGYGYRVIEGMYEQAETSYIIPHMSAKMATQLCYKYAQESFVYSVRQDPAPNPDDAIVHQMCYVNFTEKAQDPNFPMEQYGPVYSVPAGASHTVKEQTTDLNDFAKMADAPDYYSAVPSKGPKKGPKFSMDFDFEKGRKGNITSPMANPRSPKYQRMEETYISIKLKDVPNTPEAKKLMESINDRSKRVNESNRVGSSRWRERLRMIGEKKKLAEMIKKNDE